MFIVYIKLRSALISHFSLYVPHAFVLIAKVQVTLLNNNRALGNVSSYSPGGKKCRFSLRVDNGFQAIWVTGHAPKHNYYSLPCRGFNCFRFDVFLRQEIAR